MNNPIPQAARSVEALVRSMIFFLKLFPMLPSRPVDWITRPPVIEKIKYPRLSGETEGELYRPSTGGPHPGMVVCLGVVPFGQDHPQVPILGNALARAGFAGLLYWSPSMRDFRLDPRDLEDIPLAYQWLIERPDVDPARSGLLGTCVGGSFSLMAAAHPLIRDRVAFLAAYAPYSSMWTFARDIASGTRTMGDAHEPWKVDQLTRRVFVHSLTAVLEPDEAEKLNRAFEVEGGHMDGSGLSAGGRAVYDLLTTQGWEGAESALHCLPPAMQQRLTAMSPVTYLKDIHAPALMLLHDEGDQVIPVGESRRLVAAFEGRGGVHYTEMHFSHLDPAKGRLPWYRLAREFGKFYAAVYPLFRQAVGA